jgi:RNA polymerase sigma-70 factor (ECF subfamily)
LRSWLYRIATNVCLDMLNGRNRRARPMDLNGPSTADTLVGATRPESEWVLPVPDERVIAVDGDPADLAEARESIRLAFIAALQHLPPRQRAVLLLRDVVRWHANEVAEFLDTSDASVNSALQRARSTIAASNITETDPVMPMDEAQQELLDRYLDAFERYDMESLTTLIHEDAMQSMPPFELWLRGRDEILAFWQTQGAACEGSRLVPTVANGKPAFGQYRCSTTGEGHDPWALQVLDIVDGQLVELSFFLDTETLFPLFGLPSHLDP